MVKKKLDIEIEEEQPNDGGETLTRENFVWEEENCGMDGVYVPGSDSIFKKNNNS